MKPVALWARVAWAQALLTVAALVIVVLASWLGVNELLAVKADQRMQDLLTPTIEYLDLAPAGVAVDWELLTAELEELRPSTARIEVRRPGETEPVLALGIGIELGSFRAGCDDRGLVRRCAASGRDYSVLIGVDRSADLAVRDTLMITLVVACAIAAIGVAVASRLVTRRALLPLADLSTRVDAIVPGSTVGFEPSTQVRELVVLEQRFADLLTRFEQALARERDFVAQASHELRTPLTVARAEIEALHSLPSVEQKERALAALARLEGLVEVLLWFARAQAQLVGEPLELVNLADLVVSQVDEKQRLCPERVFRVEVPDEALVQGDERLLERAVGNLLENAVKHGSESQVDVCMKQEAERTVLSVRNAGNGIAESDRERVFEPFYRGQHAGNGFGLGLPFARAVARAHGGDLTLGARAARETEVLLSLPLVAWNAAAPSA
jgi:signal transduction histidine kinase